MAFAVGSGIKRCNTELELSFNIHFDESLQKILPILSLSLYRQYFL